MLKPWNGQGTEAAPFELWTCEDVDALQQYVNQGGQTYGMYLMLMTDLDFDTFQPSHPTGVGNFEPIGTKQRPFSGCFDGNGHVLKRILIEEAPKLHGLMVGIFRHTQAATIQRLDVEQLEVQGACAQIGGLIGISTDTTLKNIRIQGRVENESNGSTGGITGDSTGDQFDAVSFEGEIEGLVEIGGLVGEANGTTFTACESHATLVGRRLIGGMIYKGNHVHVTHCRVSGVIQATEDSVGGMAVVFISSCVSQCEIDTELNASGTVGGLAASSQGSIFQKLMIQAKEKARMNIGGVMAYSTDNTINEVMVTGEINGNKSIGGFIAHAIDSVTIQNAHAAMTLHGLEDVGGLIGHLRSGYQDEPTCLIEHSLVTGLNDAPDWGGAILGSPLNGQKSCSCQSTFWDVERTTQHTTYGEGVGVQTAQLIGEKAGETLTGFDFETIWMTTSAYPTLRQLANFI